MSEAAKLAEAYVKEENRVLDPSKLSKKAIDRLPQPTGWRILLLPFQGKKKTSGGIYLPDEVQEREAVGTVCGYVLRVGPLAYQDYNKFSNTGAWCKEGDFVITRAYSGTRIKIHGREFRIINDDTVEAVVDDPRGYERA